ncbi:MAG TPA: hypothetical protein VG675_01060 [Bryobacteraceae bacterium]|nr:hypothetical protein [Bryobacteraceae bacterium]
MRHRASIAVLAIGILGASVFGAPYYGSVVSSARTFQRYFRDLDEAGSSLNPIERVVYSLLLAHTQEKEGAAPGRRT